MQAGQWCVRRRAAMRSRARFGPREALVAGRLLGGVPAAGLEPFAVALDGGRGRSHVRQTVQQHRVEHRVWRARAARPAKGAVGQARPPGRAAVLRACGAPADGGPRPALTGVPKL